MFDFDAEEGLVHISEGGSPSGWWLSDGTYDTLLRVARAAEKVKDVLERVVDSFPDNETPHPSIEECLNAYGDLNRELEALPEHLR